jgi:hypothetical protein
MKRDLSLRAEIDFGEVGRPGMVFPALDRARTSGPADLSNSLGMNEVPNTVRWIRGVGW